ncbi:hypothetical protein LAZ67_3004808, partial [Cordylochernes scorpioides]
MDRYMASVNEEIAGGDLHKLKLIYEGVSEIKTETKILFDELFEQEEVDEEKEFEGYETIQDKMEKLELRLRRALEGRQSTADTKQAKGLETVTLPKFELPHFYGDANSWFNFKEVFGMAIDQNPGLNDLQKLLYLGSAVKGEAARLIRGFPVSSESYKQAWDTLVSRYDNQRELAYAQLNKIFKIKQMKNPSAKALRELLDTCNESVRNLGSLGLQRNELVDIILVQFLRNRIDEDMKRQLELTQDEKSFPSYENFILFLERQARSLPQGSREYQRKENEIQKDYANVHIAINTNAQICIACKAGPCKKCDKRHHTLLYKLDTEVTNTQKGAKPQIFKPVGQVNNTSIEQGSETINQVLLATAQIIVEGENGAQQICRALLDSGSQVSLITKEICEKLGLKGETSGRSLRGIGNNPVRGSSTSVDLTFKSIYRSEKYQTNALVMEVLTTEIPNFKLAEPTWIMQRDFELADPLFHISAPIDIILGADVYACLMQGEKKMLGRNQPIAMNSKLGWILMGKIDSSLSSNYKGEPCSFAVQTTSELDGLVGNFRESESVPSLQNCQGRYSVKLLYRNSPQAAHQDSSIPTSKSPIIPLGGRSAVRRSRRLQGLEPQENIAMIKQETQKKMGEYHFQPFRNPSIFTGERNQNPEKWLKEFHRVARYNCWDDSMCLANVYFFLQGTAHRWYENVEEKINSWDIFVKMFSQNFGHHVTQKDQLAENLKTRAQGKEETSDSYLQDVLHLCREVNPAMMENEIVAHLTKGISEEIYQSIIILDIASIDEFIKWCRKIEASNKKRVNKRVVFDRLPNVAAIDSADSESMEDLIRRIVREEVYRALNPESTTPEPSSLKEIIREEIEKNVASISKPIQRPPPRQSYPNQTRTFSQVPRRQYPTQTPIYNQTPPQRRTDEWRTHDNIPICFNCGRPGHVKRYCRERRQWMQRPEGHAPSTQEPQIGNHQAIRSQIYRRQSPKKLSVASSFEGEAAGVKNPPSSTAAKLQQNYVEIIIDDIAFSALVDSGSSFSVISDGLRRQLKKTMFKDSGMTLKVADGKNVTSIGRCTISLSINGLEQPLEFIVLPNSNPSIILGWDFLEASNAVIDCGRAEIRLEEAKDVLNSPAFMGKVVASRSVVIPAESTKLINVMSEELNGQNQVLFEPSKKVLIGKGLTLPCALFRLSHNKGKLWIVNSSTTAQIVPKGMCLGKIQRVEENNLTAISECSEFNKEVKNANHASHADKSDFKFLQNLISDDLSEEQQSQILSILKRYEKIFDKNNEPVKQTSVTKHKIETGNHQPIKHRPYRVSPTERQAIQTEVDKMLDAGIIRHSESPWSSPVILVKKKDGNWRFCVDYRRLNKVTKKDVYPLPRIDDTLDSLKGAKFYSSMDLRSGYWQIEVDEADREKTAFITPDGLYEFLVMPFGLCNAPATFERMMDKILKGLKWTMALCYLDDIVVYSKSFNEHLHRLEIILQCLDKAELRLNPKKCLFGTKRIRVFGHLVDSKGIYPDPEKIEAIAKFPTPKSITDVRSFIGLCSYYRRFIENFAEKAAPLHEVLKKDNKFTWNSDQQDAFDSLKKALMSEPVLAYFEEQLPTELHTDASGYGIGAVLVQINDGKERPVGYASRTLSKAEKNYSTTERECLAAIWAINKFRPYLFGREFVIVTDHHALCWLSNLKDPTGRLARWALKLQEYNVTVVYKSGRKHQDADCLSRNPLQLESEEAYNDEDDDIPSITALTCFEAEQRKDPKINKLIDETEIFGAESKGYEMLKGTLYKKNFDPLGNQHLLVIPKHLRLELLKSLHDAPTAGHLGFSKTYERVKNKYFWPGLLRDIRKYVAHCKECQRKKQSTQKPPGLLKAIPPASSPFQRVGMDLLGRFPKSDTGNKWIIVCTDYLTRFAVTKALPTGEAKEAAKFLMEDVVLKHGAPREIITDRGRVFQSKLIAELTNQCSSIHRFTTAYHPQTNGLTERLNKTLANMIAMYVSVEQKDWDVILPYVTFAYNTAKQDTTGFTPFKLIHGREAETTVDTLFPNPHEDLQEDYSQKIASRVEETRQLARLETLKAQEKDKARYDSKHEAMDYNVGDLVWIFIPIRKVGLSEKLMKRYFGPYRVTRKLSDVTFEVEPVDQTTRRRQTRDLVHVLRMKPYHDPEDQADLFKFQRFIFFLQETEESVSQYLVAIKRLAATCEFGNFLEDSLREKFVCGLSDSRIQKKILSEGDVSLARVMEIALSMEAAEQNIKLFHAEELKKGVDKLRIEMQRESKNGKRKCKHCRNLHRDSCRFKDAVCFKCRKKVHIAPVCRNHEVYPIREQASQQNMIHQMDDQGETEELIQNITCMRTPHDYRINTTTSDPPYIIRLKVEKICIDFELDTGSCLTLISENDFKKYLPNAQLKTIRMIIKTYDGTVVPILGEVIVKVEFQGKTSMLRAVVVKGEKKALLGREWINLLKIDYFAVNQIPSEIAIAEFLKEHQVLFNDTAEPIKGFTFSMNICDVSPIFHKARPVPFAIRTAVTEALENMVTKGYLYRVKIYHRDQIRKRWENGGDEDRQYGRQKEETDIIVPEADMPNRDRSESPLIETARQQRDSGLVDQNDGGISGESSRSPDPEA